MRLQPIEIEKIAVSILKHLVSVDIKVPDVEKAKALIISCINANIEDEHKLEQDALKLLNQHKQALGGSSIDESKAIRMIKEKLASERKFVL